MGEVDVLIGREERNQAINGCQQGLGDEPKSCTRATRHFDSEKLHPPAPGKLRST